MLLSSNALDVYRNAPRSLRSHLQAAQKDLRGEARERSTSGGVLGRYVGARRLSATKHMSLFQQPGRRKGRGITN